MKSETKKFQIIFLALLVVVLGLGALYGVLFSSIKEKNEHVYVLMDQDKQALDDIYAVSSIKRLLAGKQEELGKLDSHFVTSEGIVEFLNTLEQYGVDASLTTTDILDVTESRQGEPEELRVTVGVLGSFEQVMTFILLLENSPFELEISKMITQKSLSSGGSGLWEGLFDVTLKSFVKI